MTADKKSKDRTASQRLAFIFNLLLLCFNLLFFSIIRWNWFSPFGQLITRHDVEKHLEMKLVYSENDLALFTKANAVGKDFKLAETDSDLLVSHEVKPSISGEEERRLSLTLGSEYETRVLFSSRNGLHLHEITTTISDAVFTDLNGDGIYDMRFLEPSRDSSSGRALIQVWYQGDWINVDREIAWNKHRSTLANGMMVEFDPQSGKWTAKD